MNLISWLHHQFPIIPSRTERPAVTAADLIDFKIVVVEFSDNVESNSGETITRLLNEKEGISASYYDAPFPKTFLNLESRTLFDLIDRGQALLDRTRADVLVWGYREGDKIRLNFQTEQQYENEDCAFVSLLDSLYVPAETFGSGNHLPYAVGNLIYGAVVSSLNAFSKEKKIQKRYLLKKIISQLSKDDSAKSLSIDYLPYIMNFLGIIYLSYCYDNHQEKDFKIVKNLFDTALKHQDLIKNPIHLGCIYYHLGQLYDTATQNMLRRPTSYYRDAITFYRQAQKHLSKYNYPYDYGYISYKLSLLFFNYWKQKTIFRLCATLFFNSAKPKKFILMPYSRNSGRNSRDGLAICCRCWAVLPKVKKFANWPSPVIKTAKKSSPNGAILSPGPKYRKKSAKSITALAKNPPTKTCWKKHWNISMMLYISLKIPKTKMRSKSSIPILPKPARYWP